MLSLRICVVFEGWAWIKFALYFFDSCVKDEQEAQYNGKILFSYRLNVS